MVFHSRERYPSMAALRRPVSSCLYGWLQCGRCIATGCIQKHKRVILGACIAIVMAEQHDPEKLFTLVRISSADRLHYADDVHALIQAALPGNPDIIYGIAFRAKFIVRTQNIL